VCDAKEESSKNYCLCGGNFIAIRGFCSGRIDEWIDGGRSDDPCFAGRDRSSDYHDLFCVDSGELAPIDI
jgi:hypothetical protein